jgi:protein-S-isoprenylcysteine O-methyltransferase Ste14
MADTPPVQASTTWVFRYRFWIFGLIFWGGFALNGVDHVNTGQALLRLASPDIDFDVPNGRLALQLLFGVGALLTIAAAAVRTWATAYIRTDVVHDTQVHADRLVADGPYRFVRNPLYLGGLLLALGFAIFASRLGGIEIVAGILVLELTLIHGEERQLLRTHGLSFIEYRQAVPALWPSLTPRLPAGGGVPRWPQAFVGEAFFWAFAAGSVALALTLEGSVLWIVSGIGIAFHLIVVGWLNRRTRQREAAALLAPR